MLRLFEKVDYSITSISTWCAIRRTHWSPTFTFIKKWKKIALSGHLRIWLRIFLQGNVSFHPVLSDLRYFIFVCSNVFSLVWAILGAYWYVHPAPGRLGCVLRGLAWGFVDWNKIFYRNDETVGFRNRIELFDGLPPIWERASLRIKSIRSLSSPASTTSRRKKKTSLKKRTSIISIKICASFEKAIKAIGWVISAMS